MDKYEDISESAVKIGYPEYFPGTVRATAYYENHLLFCALACVQLSLEMIPGARALYDDIVSPDN